MELLGSHQPNDAIASWFDSTDRADKGVREGEMGPVSATFEAFDQHKYGLQSGHSWRAIQ
jgi:hypothetical protein